MAMSVFNLKNLTFSLKSALVIIILFLIYNEIKGYTLNIENFKENFNYFYFFIALFFFILTQLIGSYIIFLVLKMVVKVKLLHILRIIFTGQFFDYIPFFGIAYKAKKFKDDLKFSYKRFVSSYIILLQVGLLTISLALCLLYFLPIENFVNINLKIFYLFFLFFLFSVFFIIFYKKIYYCFIKKFFFIPTFKKKIYLFSIFLSYFYLLRRSLSKNYYFLRFIFYDYFAHVTYFFCFLFVFKSYGIEINFIEVLFIYFVFSFSTQFKILPKNYGVDELVGSYLIQLSSGSFVLGLAVMITIRLISLISTLFLFIMFNVILKNNIKH